MKYYIICHLTTAHPRNDVRIFEKECISLSQNTEYQVVLIVADGKGNELNKNVKIIDISNRDFIKNRIDYLWILEQICS